MARSISEILSDQSAVEMLAVHLSDVEAREKAIKAQRRSLEYLTHIQKPSDLILGKIGKRETELSMLELRNLIEDAEGRSDS